MMHFYNGKKVENYVTFVDTEVNGGVENTATKEVNMHEKVIEKTHHSYKNNILRTKTIVVILLLGLSAAVMGLIFRSYVQNNEIRLLKKLVCTDAIQKQWFNSSAECDFEISDNRMIHLRRHDSHVINGQKRTGCVAICSHMKKIDPLINGVTVFGDNNKEGCWCHRNMTAISMRYQSCFFEVNYTAITKEIDDAAYTCERQPGYGSGGVGVDVGNLKGNACINACLYLKQVDNTVNGVSMYQTWYGDSCYCQKGMRKLVRRDRWDSTSTCWLVPRRNTSVTDTVDDKLCSFSIGDAYGGTKIPMRNQNGYDCVQDCMHMRRIDSSINGVTINPKEGHCWCDKSMVNITSTYETCFLNSTANTTACHFSSGNGISKRRIQMHDVNRSECVDRCLGRKLTYPSINGVTVYSYPNGGGCVCNINMTSIEAVHKTCFLKPNISDAPADYNDTRPTCEFKTGDGDGVNKVYLGKYKGESCINACLHLKHIDNTVNGVTTFGNSSIGGCWCQRGMKSHIKPYISSPPYKSCILEYNDTETVRRKSQAMSICNLANGSSFGRSTIYLNKQSKLACIEGCSHLKRVDSAINGIKYDITTKQCYCQRQMRLMNKYKSCFLKS